MSKRNIFALAMLGAAFFAGTAAADGKTKRVYKPGPAPLNITCPSGYLRDSRGQCVRPAPRTTTNCPSGYSLNRNGQCIRIAQARPAPRPAPRPVSRPVPRPAPRPAPVQQASYDLSGFNGGVGAGVSGGFYGGGGFIQTAPARSFSGVLNSPGAVFAFNQRAAPAPKRPAPRPMPRRAPVKRMMPRGGRK